MKPAVRLKNDVSKHVYFLNRSAVYIVYGLYIARFFTIVSLPFGFLIALILRRVLQGAPLVHIYYLLKLFYLDVIFMCSTFGLFIGCFWTVPINGFDVWQALYLIPLLLFVGWNVMLLVSLVNGVSVFSSPDWD